MSNTEYCPVCRNALAGGQRVQPAELPLNPTLKVWVLLHERCAQTVSTDADVLSRTVDLLKHDQAFLNKMMAAMRERQKLYNLGRN